MCTMVHIAAVQTILDFRVWSSSHISCLFFEAIFPTPWLRQSVLTDTVRPINKGRAYKKILK